MVGMKPFLAGALCALFLRGSADGMLLAERGVSGTTVVVLPENPSESQRHAAAELAKYLQEMSGVVVPVGARADAKRAIVFRTTDDLGTDGFELTAAGDRLEIAGSARRGCLYGVYELLERLGCGFYSPTCERVPQLEKVELPKGFHVVERPVYRMRQVLYGGLPAAFKAKLRCNWSTWQNIPEKFGGHDFVPSRTLVGHTFSKLIDPEKLFDSHPEYFSLVKGRRQRGTSQLCLTNPDVYRIVSEKVLAAMRAEPGAQLFTVCPNDWYGYCECPSCKAIDDAEGSHAGAYLAFLNRLAEDTVREFPDNYIRGSAYQYTRKPPKTLRPHGHVFFGFSPVEADFSTPLDKSAYSVNRAAIDEIRTWAKGTTGVFTFTDYVTNFRYYPLTFPNLEGVFGNMRLLRDLGFQGVYAMGSHDGRGGFLADLRAWVQAKLLWNPDRDGWALVREFCDGFYGDRAGPIVFDYVRRLHALPRDEAKHPLKIVQEADDPTIPDAFLDESLEAWTRAEELVKDDPTRLENVRFGKYSTVFHILRRRTAPVWVTRNASRLASVRDLAKWIVAFADSVPDGLVISEHGPSLKTLSCYRQWKRMAEGDPSLVSGTGVVEEDAMVLYYRGDWVDVMDDPAAGNGKAARIRTTCNSWPVQCHFAELTVEDGTTCRVRIRVRVEKTAAAKPDDVAFLFGVTDGKKRHPGKRILRPVKFSEVDADYRWLEMPDVQPAVGDYVWFAIGGYDRPGFRSNPGLEGVWIDCIEFSEKTAWAAETNDTRE